MNKILIADDKEENRYVLSNFFKLFGSDAGITIFEASTGQEALEIVRREKPKLVIMDVKMETKNAGFDTIKLIRNDPDISDTQIWVITAQVIESDESESNHYEILLNDVCDEFILKPFDHIELLKKAAKFLQIEIPKIVQDRFG